jgi:epsilon-lactone hydrolase
MRLGPGGHPRENPWIVAVHQGESLGHRRPAAGIIETRPATHAVRLTTGEDSMSKEQQQALDAILRQGPLDLLADAPTLRAAFNQVMSFVPVPGDVDQKPTTIGGVNGLEVTIQETESENVILYFHGGVYVIGSAATSVSLVSDLARRAGARAVTLDYRLAPEHPYPAAVEDAQAAYAGLLQQGIDPGQIALAGDSAGGGLAVATLLALRDAGTPLPACAYLMSPYADLTLSGATIHEKHAVDLILTPDGLRLRIPEYVAGADAADPLISPVFGDLRGLPPLLIQVGSHEVLLSDSLRLAARAATADVAVTLEVTPGAPHVFQGYAAMLDEGNVALDRAAAFLNTQFAANRSTQAA